MTPAELVARLGPAWRPDGTGARRGRVKVSYWPTAGTWYAEFNNALAKLNARGDTPEEAVRSCEAMVRRHAAIILEDLQG